ncbi:hypothetical protein RN96_14800, partial [Fusobacterium polymorphum]
MLDYTKVESRLKSFLKNNKRLGYSVALLVSFLINGGFSYAIETRAELRDRIVQEQENISQMLKDSDKSISDIELKIKKLTQRGEFWVKPLERSYQVAFITSFGNYTKNRNRTEQNFTEPEYGTPGGRRGSSGNIYMVDINGITELANNKATTGNKSNYKGSYNYKGKNYGEYGIIKNPLEFVDKIDFGANITPKAVAEKTVAVKTVSETRVTEPRVSVSKIDVSRVTVTPPSAPIISAPANPGNPSVNVTAPGAITPLGTITVAAIPAINVSVAAPVVGAAPTVNAPTVATPPTPGGFSPAKIPLPSAPNDPAKPGISIFNPIDLTFNGTGFGQGASSGIPQSNVIIENFGSYITGNGGADTLKITSGAGGTSWTGTTLTGNGASPSGGMATGTLSPGSTTSYLAAFISDAADHSVTINGKYDMTRNTDTGNGTIMFVSLNPYYVQNSDKTYDFQGDLILRGHNNPSSSNLLLGFEHQLLTYVKAGTANGTSILKNSGNITMQEGYNIVGIQIDTEYGGSGNAPNSSEFTKQPQTINAGSIIINSKQSIGVDYGYYSGHAPNTKLHVGNIVVNGENNYGLRMKNYHAQNPNYYDKTEVTGANGVIKVNGKKNVGVYVAQGKTTGDPASNMSALQVLVSGENNIGFLRSGSTGVNSAAITLDSTKLGTNFGLVENAATKKSTLIRSDFGEVILDRAYSWESGTLGEGNTFLQAGKTGSVTYKAGNIFKVKAKEFYGMTAGNFEEKNKTSGATATNNGTLEITGEKSIAMAADENNTIKNTGTLKVTGKKTTGIYNLGTFTQSGATSKLEVSGEKSLGLYNKGTMTLAGTATISGTKGAIGIFSDGGTITSTMGSNLTITSDDTGISKGDSKGLGVYAAKGANVTINSAKINVTGGSVGIAAVGKNSSNVGAKITAQNSIITYDGEGYAVYTADGGQIDVTNATINLAGKATGMEINKAIPGQITATGATIKVKSNDVTVFNLTNVTTPLSIATLETSLTTESGVTNITPDPGITKYKLASLDGGSVNIDAAISRTDAVGTAGYNYYRRFLSQRTKLNVTKNVTAIMTTTQANDYNNQVVGLEMNSSKNATSNTEAAINLVSSKIIADRNGTGDGAVGAFINYGKVSVDKNSAIEVETQTGNTANDKAVGV